jgi:hypothetical protein
MDERMETKGKKPILLYFFRQYDPTERGVY